MLVLAIAGFSALAFSRALLNVALGLEGSLWSGPWSYRLTYIAVIPPIHTVTLVLVGALFGKKDYFTHRAMRMWARLIPPALRG